MSTTKHDRRRPTQIPVDHLRGDQITKQVIVFTLCGCVAMMVGTICYLALQSMEVPESLDRLVTFVVGNLSGALAKTGIDKILSSREGQPAGTEEDPIVTETTGPDKGLVKVKEVKEPQEGESEQ